MVHNGIEYGIMAAYAEGLGVLRSANVGKQQHEVDAETTPLRDPEHYQYDLNLRDIAEVWRRGSVIASWLLDLTAAGSGERSCPRAIRGPRLGFRRRPMDDQGRHRRSRAGAGSLRRSLSSVSLRAARRIIRTGCSPPCASGSAGTWRKPPANNRPSEEKLHEQFSVGRFGLLWRHGRSGLQERYFRRCKPWSSAAHLNVPVIGVAKAGWNLDQLRKRGRAIASRNMAGSILPLSQRLSGLLRYVDGDYNDPATFQALRKELGGIPASRALPGHSASAVRTVIEHLAKTGLLPGRSRHRRETLRP